MRLGFYFLGMFVSLCALRGDEPMPPLSPQSQKLRPVLQERLQQLDAALKNGPQDLQFYSQRGDTHFFLGDFRNALSDYDKMVELDPTVLTLHWRRGLAQFYVGQYQESATQFERYFEQDQSDRENGIWRFYAQVRQLGLEEARKKLLPYEKPDRAPLPDIYDLCAGKLTAAELESRLVADGLSPGEQAKRDFYGHLYLGLDYAIKDQPAQAKPHLEQALASEWAQTSGYGPNYMWQIARLQWDLLATLPMTSP